MSWGVQVRWEGVEKHPAEVSGSKGRLWRCSNGSCIKVVAEVELVYIPVLQSRDVALGCLYQLMYKKHWSPLVTPGSFQTVIYFTPSFYFKVLPAEPAWPQGHCAAVTALCSCILSGPASVHIRHKRCMIGCYIFPSMSQFNTLQTLVSRSSPLYPNQRCFS